MSYRVKRMIGVIAPILSVGLLAGLYYFATKSFFGLVFGSIGVLAGGVSYSFFNDEDFDCWPWR